MTLALVNAINWLSYILIGLLFVRVFLSWMPMFRGPVVDFIHMVTEPVLAPIRRLIDRSPLGGPGMIMDFSPIIAMIMLRLVANFAIGFLR